VKSLLIQKPGVVDMVEVPIPKPGPDDVLIQVKVCTTCPHWDISVWQGWDIFERAGHPKYPQPFGRPGHEMAGVVVEKGANVSHLRVGDRVAVLWAAPMDMPGFYAEYGVKPASEVFKLPDWMSFEEASVTELLVAICVPVIKLGDVIGKRVGVSGLGPAGMLAVQALRARGAKEVVGFVLAPERLKIALEVGAHAAVDPRSSDVQAYRDKPLDLAIDCIAVNASLELMLDIVKEKIIIFGVPRSTIHYGYNPWKSGVALQGHGVGSARAQSGEYAVHLLTTKQVTTKPLISEIMPMSEYAKGIELLQKSKAVLKVSYVP